METYNATLRIKKNESTKKYSQQRKIQQIRKIYMQKVTHRRGQ